MFLLKTIRRRRAEARSQKATSVRGGWGTARRFAGATDGSALVETVLVVPVMVLMIVGSLDIGKVLVESVRLEAAAQAGTQYGIQDQASAGSIPQIIAAAREDAGDATAALDISARQFCSCPTQGEVLCTSTCLVDGKFPPMYVEVTVRNAVALTFGYPGVQSPVPLESMAMARVR